MSERTLPFALDVPCIAYHNLAFPLGIMKANISNFDEWLCNKLIDCKYENNYGRYNLFDSDIWEYAKGVTQTQSFHITPDLFNCNAFDIIGIIRYMIDHGNYIMGLLNEKYLPMKKAYGKYDFVHDFLIYGYDDNNRVFRSAGYTSRGHYELYDMSYDDYLQSMKGFCFSRFAIYFHKIATDHTAKLDVSSIKSKIEKYLNSTDDSDGKDLYGIGVWSKLARSIRDEIDRGIDIRFTRSFMEHKSLMSHRLNYLTDKGIIADEAIFRRYSESVVTPANKVYLLSMKYNMTNREELRNNISERILQIADAEKDILTETISSL